jgi:hypothetical protein
MGIDLALLAIADSAAPDLSRPLTADASEIVHALFPRTSYVSQGPSPLDSGSLPARGDLWVGRFQGGILLSTRDAHLYNPTKLAKRYLKPALGAGVTLITQRSSNDMFAYARWTDGRLTRSISVNPIGRIWESIGPPEPWERPFWRGDRPVGGDYPLPFHPLDMSDAALRSVLRLHYEGPPEAGLIEPASVVLHVYQATRRMDR